MRYIATIALALLPALTPVYALPTFDITPAFMGIHHDGLAGDHSSSTDEWQYAPFAGDIAPRNLIRAMTTPASSIAGLTSSNFSYSNRATTRKLYYASGVNSDAGWYEKLIVIPEPATNTLLHTALLVMLGVRARRSIINEKQVALFTAFCCNNRPLG
ncbi:hypothetical protein O5O45_20010 [Hahella aquimaris]|uniref:hypothetical protein n=1 Tax=Hahella sp. HNIBRBA332 TaxID=3015983 RepID=UPI00273BBB31|nr:hypothetical protein [Hahella sp. HNIBRBA332]WLQ12015.1 hypothetical protein O5O45_20010 [Hahella sp. HNIBRBA332]